MERACPRRSISIRFLAGQRLKEAILLSFVTFSGLNPVRSVYFVCSVFLLPYVRHKGQSYPEAKSLSISPVTRSFARFSSD